MEKAWEGGGDRMEGGIGEKWGISVRESTIKKIEQNSLINFKTVSFLLHLPEA